MYDTAEGDISAFTPLERMLAADAERALSDGLTLRRWWLATAGSNAFRDRFPVVRDFNGSDESFGFFDEVAVPGIREPLPVMGVFERTLYDSAHRESVADVIAQLREFVLRYFLRASAFREPEAYVPRRRQRSYLASALEGDDGRRGFGYTQLLYKTRDTGRVQRFSADEQSAIVDLRELRTKYAWLVLKVDIFAFDLTFRLSSGLPRIVVPMTEAAFLVISADFVVDREAPGPGVAARFGFGYAFLKSPPTPGVIAYGPGRFDASFQTVVFDVCDNGGVAAELLFVANRPRQILRVPVNPLSWGLELVDVFSLGVASRAFSAIREAVDAATDETFDPLDVALGTLSALPGAGDSARREARQELEKSFLVQHVQEHYRMLSGSLMTWRRVSDWLTPSAVPRWIARGASQ